MEFIKELHGEKVFGKYKHLFSSETNYGDILGKYSEFDFESELWFTEISDTFSSVLGFTNANFHNFMAMEDFWNEHRGAYIRETYYHWYYEDERPDSVSIFYTITEYRSGLYRTCRFTIRDVSEEQFQNMERALLEWHKRGIFMLGSIEMNIGEWKERYFSDETETDDVPYIGALIEKHTPMDMDTIVRSLAEGTYIQSEFIERIAEVIHENYEELLSENPQNTDIARELYTRVISSAEIRPILWLHQKLEWIITDPIPFA